jgi:uncharacterized membrane protein YphA (DoxX/SURF4 family)
MKYAFVLVRYLTGLLFVFSGIVKLNDPSGFSIKLNEYFDVFAEDVSTRQDSLFVSMEAIGSLGEILSSSEAEFVQLYSFDGAKEFSIQSESDGFDFRYTLQESGMTKGQLDVHDTAVSAHSLKLVLSNTSESQSQMLAASELAATPDYTVSLEVKQWVKPESAMRGFFKGLKDYSLWLSGFFCALEVLLGVAMLIGYEMKITVALTAGLIVFFTFLTGYSAYFNKVTDCGCFGDFLKLEPWTSFKKDLVLSGMVTILIMGLRHNVAWFSRPFGHKLMAVMAAGLSVFAFVCYLYLPVWDFLPYKEGNDIKAIMETLPPGERASDSMRITFVLKKGADTVHTDASGYAAWAEKGFEYSDRIEEVIVKGYQWPIHDFSIIDIEKGIDKTEEFLQYEGYQWVFVATFLESAYKPAFEAIKPLAKMAATQGQPFYALSSTSSDIAAEFAKTNDLGFSFHSTDQKTLMTMARYNPTLYLFKGPVVLKKWSGRHLPSPSVFDSKLMKD